MRMFIYYVLHTFKNQLKKLLKTWLLVFFVVVVLISAVFGMVLGSVVGPDDAEEPADTEIAESPDVFDFDAKGVKRADVLELAAGGLSLAMLVFCAMGAEKSGSTVFKPADANLLFASPMRPQSVLMFRLSTQLGIAFLSGLYMLFHIPQLTNVYGFSLWGALALAAAWCLSIAFGQLIRMLLYMLASAHPALKRWLRWCIFAVLLAVAGGFMLFASESGDGYLKSAVRFFNAKPARFIPVWGWLKGLCFFAEEGSALGALLCLAALFAGGAAIVYVIWHVKADFYEDALAKSEETAELMRAMQSEKSTGVAVKRGKDRSEKLRRDGLCHGRGANVFFFKTMYNRFRFAKLGIFTKTMEVYLVVAAVAALVCRYNSGGKSFTPVAAALAICVFYRTFGNPLGQDTQVDYFVLIPESAWAKLFWSLIGGTVGCFLDVLPAVAVGALIIGGNPLIALAYVPLIMSLDFYATNVGTFIALSAPVSAGKLIKQAIQAVFLYFGLLPDVIVISVGSALDRRAVALVCAALLNVGLGFLFFAFSPSFLEPKGGRQVPNGTGGAVCTKS